MSTREPRVFTIAPDRPFLRVLAAAVLAGFPGTGTGAPSPLDLTRWTILLPTRRATRELERIFFELSGGKGMFLPRIKPIGDIDEDLLPGDEPQTVADVSDAITPAGQLLQLMDLIDGWARENPQTRLAQELAHAPHQAHALALSLAEFLDSLETEDIDAARIPELYGLESARHREAILEFLAIAREKYPARLNECGLLGPTARRSLILRREALRLSEYLPETPVIAAGSTGSIPATRALLKSIALLPHGAVVLPGLDTAIDDASWNAVGHPHPQYALKQLIDFLGIERQAVRTMAGAEPGARGWLASEIMRPAETSEAWHGTIAGNAGTIAGAMMGVELIETRHVQEEATVIAIILRHCLETPGKTASLVTPDRNLARRVKAELRRWDIAIDDSGGEPLIRSGGAALLNLLLDAVRERFSPETLAALLRHELCSFGEAPETARHCSSIIELALLRTGRTSPGITQLPEVLRSLWTPGTPNPHRHTSLRRIAPEDWERTIAYASAIAEAFAPLLRDDTDSLSTHLGRLVAACEAMAGERLWQGDQGAALRDVIATLQSESHLLHFCDFARAAVILRHWLTAKTLRPPGAGRFRLSVLGLLEARLMRPELMVLAGLNEATWPGLPDAGPWLNRPMRDILGMQQPERDIGQTAHDFAQAFGAAEVKLIWARRIDDAPAIPSRWILRLQMLLKAAGLEDRLGAGSPWQQMAQRLSEPRHVEPLGKPRPTPPVDARPRQLSVTRIETLIRDPYAIYARHVLGLEPVDPIAAAPDPAKRGIIFHGAIGEFLNACPLALPANAANQLLRIGAKHFEEVRGYPDITSFWWPRFARIAAWLVSQEAEARPQMRWVHAEIAGGLELDIAGRTFTLTCRADRIDLLKDGTARIADYKTGTIPSAKKVNAGLAPQLTLQAAILAQGGFRDLGPVECSALVYVKLGGGDPPGEVKPLDFDQGPMAIASDHLARLTGLLAGYGKETQPYLPRTIVEKEDEVRDYDHLSRFREWALAGTSR